ncbi:lysylphosphatidylglycerol synthase transmembrane domain-containing protein [Sulfurivermis fontis]|uniref:lysylphosphatidylglycerol synthase transmembrane domain-containing protein n=1 Tax=Sulfurivermis fontis TaxID=1972068 RepID=UPI000FD6FB1A|nr:lysylphosphatidylglycerol synthase transmembrane domain-containing protein [Sulfurivermis fontis]
MTQVPARPVRGLRALILSVVAAAVGYLGFSLWGGWQDVVAALRQVSLPVLLLLLLLSLVNYGLRFARWQHYLALFGHRVPWRQSLRIYLGGFALTTTPGKAGEALRCVLLQPHGVSWPHSLAALLAERLGDLMAILLLAAIGLAAWPQGRGVIVLLAAVLVVLLLCIQQRAWLARLDGWLRTRFHGRAAALAAGLIETMLHSSRLFTLPLLLYSAVLGVVAWGAEGLAFYYLVQVLGTDLDLLTALFIYAFAMLVGAVSFLPGGLGGAELAMVTLLTLHGMPPGVAVAATVIIRLATLWFAVVLGALALLPGRRGPWT